MSVGGSGVEGGGRGRWGEEVAVVGGGGGGGRGREGAAMGVVSSWPVSCLSKSNFLLETEILMKVLLPPMARILGGSKFRKKSSAGGVTWATTV